MREIQIPLIFHLEMAGKVADPADGSCSSQLLSHFQIDWEHARSEGDRREAWRKLFLTFLPGLRAD